MLDFVKRLWSLKRNDSSLERSLDSLRERAPIPVIWLFGKTQSGKTSIIKYLTGAADAEIGEGFRPCTRTSRIYQFPDAEAPLLSFLDTRGLDEPDYDASEDIAEFNDRAQLILVTVRLLDHAIENLLAQLKKVRSAKHGRPVILAVTTLHEAYPQQQHPEKELQIAASGTRVVGETALERSLAEQCRRFDGLVDEVVPIDFTKLEEGFDQMHYGGERLKQAVLEQLPSAYRQSLLTLDRASHELKDLQERESLPIILGYAGLAATAGAVPIPWLDLLILPGIQAKMIAHLARKSGHPMDARRFAELAASLGIGLLARQAVREVVKLVPYVGSVVGAALASGSTYALGKVFLYYDRVTRQGHVPDAAELRKVYQEELTKASQIWKKQPDRRGV